MTPQEGFPSLRVAVRELVEFVIHGEDLVASSGGPGHMAEGSQAHRARQRLATEEGYQAEVPMSLTLALGGMVLEVSGRADGLFVREGLTMIEEIKLLFYADAPPPAPWPEHVAQARCYGHMLCQAKGLSQVGLRVLYVTVDGTPGACFEEVMGTEALAAWFAVLALPYIEHEAEKAAHRLARDASLKGLAFPHVAFRAGQRHFSAQVYTAIKRRRRLLAQAPTGTGKTMATLYPALKALGEGLTSQVFYLTARTTGRALALEAVAMAAHQGAHLRVLELTAKDKICPHGGLIPCDPRFCERAKGFFLRLPQGIAHMRIQSGPWHREAVTQGADAYTLCPFEFALALTELADVVVCDYNYAFDPMAKLRRVFLFKRDLTLLVDEAHHLVERAREMFSATLFSGNVRLARRQWGKQQGRKGPLYKAMGGLLKAMEALADQLEGQEAIQLALPTPVIAAAQAFYAEAGPALERFEGPELAQVFFDTFGLLGCAQGYDETYVTLLERSGKELGLRLFCLDPAPRLGEATQKLQGVVYFSATLTPLAGYARLLGMDEVEDGRLALASPFPPERLLVLKTPLGARFAQRQASAQGAAQAMLALMEQRPGNYLAMFPSYAYLRLVAGHLEALAPTIPLAYQRGDMDEGDRAQFIAQFQPGSGLLGLVVMGGVFAEGIDLPGDRLTGVMVLSIGLPQICLEREALRAYFDRVLGDGFAYAYRIPGMTKVLQAVGRVIRTPEDVGVALLMDDRYFSPEVTCLLPAHWQNLWEVRDPDQVAQRARGHWQRFMPR